MLTTNKEFGLTSAQVEESRQKHGINVLTPVARQPLWKLFLAKFRDPLIAILLVAGVLSLMISIYEYFWLGHDGGTFFEPTGIFIAVLCATSLAFFFEMRAEKEFALLNTVSDEDPVQVIREGVTISIPRRDVVVGDIVVLNTGDEVPADGELIEATSLQIDESTLTGEPICTKTVDPDDFDPDATFPSNVVMKGTKVMEGHALMEVTAVGDSTEHGSVFRAAQIDNSIQTPLTLQLKRLGNMIARISYVIAAVIIIGRMAMYFSDFNGDWLDALQYGLHTFMLAVALLVVSVPEGLPMAVTLSLAFSMRRMLKTNNLVRRLHACETMGATTVICTDKTGTLTQNQMRVASMDIFGDVPSDILHTAIAANSTAQLDRSDPTHPSVLGNPTEGALLLRLNDDGIDYESIRSECSIESELPFTTGRKHMATVVHDAQGRRLLLVKGAPEIVYDMCRVIPEDASREHIEGLLARYQEQAMRTLGFAYTILTENEPCPIYDDAVHCDRLQFIAIAAIADPVRADVPQAIREVLGAGVAIKIVTGDTPRTAREIARQVGLWKDETDTLETSTITGVEFEALSDDELRQRLPAIKIIARARPMDKKRLVETLQSMGEVVAVTGDGTNDAPALKAAQVGLAMGDGTAVAKEAGDITIIDNSFASIGRAIMWGRSLYRNIQRFILFQITVNVTACLVVFFGALFGRQSPLTVTQMLWVNLAMDTFAAMALASLPPSSDVMRAKPRRTSDFIITRSMWRFIIGVGVTFFAVLTAVFLFLEYHGGGSISEIISSTGATAPTELSTYALSIFFTLFVFIQFWNLFNARAYGSHRSALHLGGCRGFIFIGLLIVVGQVAIVEFGGQFFNVCPISLIDWLIIIATSSVVLWVGEFLRLFRR